MGMVNGCVVKECPPEFSGRETVITQSSIA